jgi:phenylacetaldehyde dehydrogenase
MEVAELARNRVAPPVLPDGRMLIGGEWVWAASGETIPVYDPATGREIGVVARGGKADVDRAVNAAAKAFRSSEWVGLSRLDLERMLHRLADLIEQHADELAAIEAYDNGKPITMARNVDVNAAVQTFRYYAGWPSKMEGSTPPVSARSEAFHAYTLRQPIGVVGQIHSLAGSSLLRLPLVVRLC